MANSKDTLDVVGLFAGIGGIEVGLHNAGHRTVLLCENDAAAQSVLHDRFSSTPLAGDVRDLESLPSASICAAGFPCQDLSQAGRTAGISGLRSGLVTEVFRLLKRSNVEWLFLENVPFMLQLAGGEAMRFLVRSLEQLGFDWAYRVVDTRAFGLPQRRQRVILLASRTRDPKEILFAGDCDPPETDVNPRQVACGFYWTEGTRGLGWAIDAVPTLKGGSGIGIPSPPAIIFPDGLVGTPDVRDAERLQGFPADWTEAALTQPRGRGARWKLVGNAVSVPVAQWVGERLKSPLEYDGEADMVLAPKSRWPKSAWGSKGTAREACVGMWPVNLEYQHLSDFLQYDPAPLSVRATTGFLRRASSSSLRFPPGFLAGVAAHLDAMQPSLLVA